MIVAPGYHRRQSLHEPPGRLTLTNVEVLVGLERVSIYSRSLSDLGSDSSS